MSTIASPRPSVSIRSPSSSRTSLDTSHTTNNTSRTPIKPRRNRTALRDYYGLKDTGTTADAHQEQPQLKPDADGDEDAISELDKEGFDAEAYVKDIFSTHGLQGVIKVEAGLVSQIKNLDSDRKSLVYDNYSKLISATDTIRKMRTNMDPLAPTTHTLSPAIAYIAETAASLSASMHDRTVKPKPTLKLEGEEEDAKKRREKETVRWVLDTPRRLGLLCEEEREEEAEKEWVEVKGLLDKWKGVGGVAELRAECEDILKDEDSDEE